jgi:hypothetical protein
MLSDVAWRYGHAWCPDLTSPSAQRSFSAATGSSREALPKRLAAAADLFHAHVLTGNTVLSMILCGAMQMHWVTVMVRSWKG